MLTRALIVVLVILNLGVALWWLLRGEPASEPPASPAGVAQLEVLPATQAPTTMVASPDATPALQDVTPVSAPATAVADTSAPRPAASLPAPAPVAAAPAAPAVPAPVTATPAPAQCVSLGPFADRAAA